MTSASRPPDAGGPARGEGAVDPRALVLAPDLPAEDARRALAARGFRRPAEADAALARLARDILTPPAFADLLPALLEELAAAGSPDRGLRNIARLIEASPGRLALAERLTRERALLARAAVLCSQSQFFADLIVREPLLLDWLAERGEPPEGAALRGELAAELAALKDEDHRLEAVRRLHRRELLACGHRDHVLGRPLEETVRSLSRIAETVIDACLGLAAARLGERRPALAKGPLPFAVIALGKLGGGELNYSSDVDLLFVHDELVDAGDLSPREAFGSLGRELLHLLSGAGGAPLYRVDMRLRPEGAQGDLSRGIAAYVRYYETYGRTWERQALLKARPVAGDLGFGARFLEAIAPFVYRRHLDLVAIGEIRALKRQIEARGRARPTRDVKEGPGGIRDVEFAVQFLLLLHGSEIPEVRDPATLGAIARLLRAECLSPEEARALREAYVFLRTVEHRLQSLYALQTHQLPADEEEAVDLARRLGFRGEGARAALDAAIERHGRAAQEVLDRVLHGLFPEPPGGRLADGARAAELLLDPDLPAERARSTLSSLGLRDPDRAMAALLRLATESSRLLARSPRTRTALAGLLPALLPRLAREALPDEALLRFERAAETLGGKAGFYQLLSSRPETLALFVRTFGESAFLSDLLARSPGALDEVVDLLLTDEPVTAPRIQERIALARAAGVKDPERAVSRATTLLVGLRDVGGIYNVTNVQEGLTALAEATLRALFPERPGLALFALGKLGGRELGYGSDLDLVPAYEVEGEPAQEATGAFLRRLAALDLYGVDLRLRPEGSAGPLSTSLRALADYYAGPRARTWERLAATKLRLVVGDEAALGPSLARVLDAIYAERPREALLREAREMRDRLASGAAGPLDLKRGPGGLLDIEFIVAASRLLSLGRPAEVRDPGIVPALHALARGGLLDRRAYVELLTGYQLLRSVEAKLRIVEGRSVSTVPEDEAAQASLARRLGYVDGKRRSARAAFLDELRYTRGRVRARYYELFESA